MSSPPNNKFGAGGVLAFEEGEDAFLLVGELGADGDEIEGAAAVHAVHLLKFGELLGAGAAPGGPEIDEDDFGGGVFAEGLEAGGLDEIDLDGFGFDSFGLLGLAAFGGPLDGAAHGGADGVGNGLPARSESRARRASAILASGWRMLESMRPW